MTGRGSPTSYGHMRLELGFLVLMGSALLTGSAQAQKGAPDTALPPRPAESSAPPTPGTAKPAKPSPSSSSPESASPAPVVDSSAALEFSWDIWWHFHQHEFLDLRRRVHAGVLLPPEQRFDPVLAPLFARAPQPSAVEIDELVAPSLLAIAGSDSGGELVAGALMGLARVGARADRSPGMLELDRLEARIASPVRGIAESAVIALGILGSERALESLGALLRDDERGRKLADLPAVPYRVRSLAAYGLGLIGQATRSQRTRQIVCRALTEALDAAPATDTQVACVLALGMTPLELDPSHSASAAWSSRETQLGYLQRLAERADTGRLVRAHAWASLARLARDAGAELRESCMRRTLASLADPGLDPLARESCILGLGELCGGTDTPGDLAAVDALFTLLRAGTASEPDAARLALVELASRPAPTRAYEQLLQRLRERLLTETHAPAARTRAWSALALGVLEARIVRSGRRAELPVRDELRALWKRESSPDAQSACALALGLCADRESSAPLSDCLARGGDDALRGYCALALGLCGDPRSVPALRAILRESTHRPFVLESSAIALGLLGEKAVVEDLLAGLGESLSQTSQGWFALAVGLVGDARALPVLVERLKDDKLTRRSRAYLAVALGMICESAPAPWAQPIAAHLAWRATSETLFSGTGEGVLEFL